MVFELRIATARISFLMLAFLVAVPAKALDLTGVWVGSFKCSRFRGGVAEKFTVKNQTLEITQSVDHRLTVDWYDWNANLYYGQYQGFVADSVSNPANKGRTAITICGTKQDLTTGYSEIVNLKGVVNPSTGKAVLTGTSNYAGQYQVNEIETGLEMGQCSWSFRRSSIADPAVPTDCGTTTP